MKILTSKIKLYVQVIMLILIVNAIILGGFNLTIHKVKLPTSAVDAFGLVFVAIFFINYKILKNPINKIEEFVWNIPQKIISINQSNLIKIIIFSIFMFTFAHSLRHLSFKTHFYDVNYIQRPLYQAFQSPFLRCDACLKNSYLAEHNPFTFFIIAPLFIFIKSNYLVFFIESLSILFPIYLLIKYGPLKNTGKLQILSIIIIFSSRALRQSLTWDFREDHLSFLFLTLSILFWHNKKFNYYLLTSLLAMMCKENVAFITLGFSLSGIFESKIFNDKIKLKYSTISLVTSIIYILFLFKIFIPFMLGDLQKEQVILLRFKEYGATPAEIIINILTSPKLLFKLLKENLFSLDRLKYVLLLTTPYIIYSKRNYWIYIPIILGLAMNVLHNQATQRMMMFHYDLIILPYLFYLLLLTLEHYKNNYQKLVIIFILSISFSGKWPTFFIKEFWPTINQVKDSYWLSKINVDQPVAMNMLTAPHLVHNKDVRIIGEFEYKSIEYLNQKVTRSEYTLGDAKYFVIENNNQYDLSLLKLLNNKLTLIEISPDNRYSFYRREN